MKIIDISKWQASVDWKKVKADGIEGVIIRAGRAKTMDERFVKHITGAAAAGLHIGVYWFSYAYAVGHAQLEAAACLKVIEPYKDKIDLCVWFDWEYDSMNNAKRHGVNPTKALITNMTKAFCAAIEKGGYSAGYYFNLDYQKRHYDISALRQYYTWYARYNNTKPTAYDVWQYTSKGRVNGIKGNVDMDLVLNKSIIGKKKTTKKPGGSIPAATVVKTDTKKVSDTKMPTIRKGSKGQAVKVWQVIVGVEVDGSFGDKTEAATKAFQKKNKLTVDGVVGTNTWRSGLESVR